MGIAKTSAAIRAAIAKRRSQGAADPPVVGAVSSFLSPALSELPEDEKSWCATNNKPSNTNTQPIMFGQNFGESTIDRMLLGADTP